MTGALPGSPNTRNAIEKPDMMDTPPLQDQRAETDSVTLVPFSTAHLPGALKLSQEMAWPYRIEDWAFALTVGQGFVLEQGGEVIGTAAWFPYGDKAATVGMIIVSRKAQGRGFGARLVDTLLHAAKGRCVLLNATPEGRALYERRGFQPVGVLQQHHGILDAACDAPPTDRVRPLKSSDIDAITRLDAEATGFDRGPLLQRLLEVGAAQVLLRDGTPAGYAITRLFGRGHVVGPVVAATPADARLLIEASLASLKGCFVRIDTSAIEELSPWLDQIGLRRASSALTMALGTMPPSGPAQVFALANQSFN